MLLNVQCYEAKRAPAGRDFISCPHLAHLAHKILSHSGIHIQDFILRRSTSMRIHANIKQSGEGTDLSSLSITQTNTIPPTLYIPISFLKINPFVIPIQTSVTFTCFLNVLNVEKITFTTLLFITVPESIIYGEGGFHLLIYQLLSTQAVQFGLGPWSVMLTGRWSEYLDISLSVVRDEVRALSTTEHVINDHRVIATHYYYEVRQLSGKLIEIQKQN